MLTSSKLKTIATLDNVFNFDEENDTLWYVDVDGEFIRQDENY
jgi:hypothetical protein